METYIGTKVVRTKPMTRGDYNLLRGWFMPEGEDPGDDGYLVEYVDGGGPNHPDFENYITWLAKDIFEQDYRPTAGMTFGQAIEALKVGKKVSRKGWNGRGMFLWLKPAAVIKSEWCKDPLLKQLCDDNGGEIQALGTVCMYTTNADGNRAALTGWLASQTDMLSEDWEIVE